MKPYVSAQAVDAVNAISCQFRLQTASTVCLSRLGMSCPNGHLQQFIPLCLLRGRAPAPVVKTRARYPQHLTTHCHRKFSPVLFYPRILGSDSRAKYAVVFFSMYLSWRASASLFRSRAFFVSSSEIDRAPGAGFSPPAFAATTRFARCPWRYPTLRAASAPTMSLKYRKYESGSVFAGDHGWISCCCRE